jgi:hypothetical protein
MLCDKKPATAFFAYFFQLQEKSMCGLGRHQANDYLSTYYDI